MNPIDVVRSVLAGTMPFDIETFQTVAVVWFAANIIMFWMGWKANYANTRAEVDFAYFGWNAETRTRYWLLSVWWDEFHRWPNEEEWNNYFNTEEMKKYYVLSHKR